MDRGGGAGVAGLRGGAGPLRIGNLCSNILENSQNLIFLIVWAP